MSKKIDLSTELAKYEIIIQKEGFVHIWRNDHVIFAMKKEEAIEVATEILNEFKD